MKILYHHRTTAQDGSAVHINGLIDALREAGAEVLVVAPGIAAERVGDKGSPSWARALRRALPQSVHELMEFAYNLPETWRLMRAVRKFKPDIIYQRSNLFLLSGALVARRSGLPLIEEVNAPYFLERSRHSGIALPGLARWAESWALRRADAVIAVTSVLSDMVATIGVSRENLHVMHNGVDQSLLESAAVDSDAKKRLGLSGCTVLGFTGFVREWNGLESVLAQLSRPEAKDWFLLIVGDGPARGALEERARQLGVFERIKFTGVVPRAEVPHYVSAFDIALQPAANPYASPLKLFEYMAMGRAIVAPNQTNIREVLTHRENALLFTPDNSEEFAAAVRSLASDTQLRTELASAARRALTDQSLTWRTNAERVLSLAGRLSELREDRMLLKGRESLSP